MIVGASVQMDHGKIAILEFFERIGYTRHAHVEHRLRSQGAAFELQALG